MDQRLDSERRQRADRKARLAGSLAGKRQSWIDTLRANRTLVLAISALIIITIVVLVVWWVHATGYVSTDDAFIDARTVSISPQVSASVVDVPVTDNELVKAGAVLVRLDDHDYQAQVDQAAAKVDQADANLADINAQFGAQKARVDQADKQATQSQAALALAQEQDQRYQKLVKTGAVTVEQAQQYGSDLLQAQATFAAEQANATATKKQLPILQAQRSEAKARIEEARASLEQAKINLSHTVITAPVAGRVAQLTVAKGDYAAQGQVLMMFVPRNVWVTANLKRRNWAKSIADSLSISRSTLIPIVPSRAASRAYSPAAAQRSACCPARTRRATT